MKRVKRKKMKPEDVTPIHGQRGALTETWGLPELKDHTTLDELSAAVLWRYGSVV